MCVWAPYFTWAEKWNKGKTEREGEGERERETVVIVLYASAVAFVQDWLKMLVCKNKKRCVRSPTGEWCWMLHMFHIFYAVLGTFSVPQEEHWVHLGEVTSCLISLEPSHTLHIWPTQEIRMKAHRAFCRAETPWPPSAHPSTHSTLVDLCLCCNLVPLHCRLSLPRVVWVSCHTFE